MPQIPGTHRAKNTSSKQCDANISMWLFNAFHFGVEDPKIVRLFTSFRQVELQPFGKCETNFFLDLLVTKCPPKKDESQDRLLLLFASENGGHKSSFVVLLHQALRRNSSKFQELILP